MLTVSSRCHVLVTVSNLAKKKIWPKKIFLAVIMFWLYIESEESEYRNLFCCSQVCLPVDNDE